MCGFKGACAVGREAQQNVCMAMVVCVCMAMVVCMWGWSDAKQRGPTGGGAGISAAAAAAPALRQRAEGIPSTTGGRAGHSRMDGAGRER